MAKSIVLKVINTTVFKRISLVIAVLLFIIQGISYVDTGGNVCGRLLNGGTLIDIDVWHPTGCMIHRYQPNDGSSCLKKQKVAFVGDKHMKNVYQSFMKKFFEHSHIKEIDTELEFKQSNLAVDFFGRPHLDSSVESLYEKWLKNKDEAPNIIIQSASLSTNMPSTITTDELEEEISNFRGNLTNLLPLMYNLVSNSSKLYWMLQAPMKIDTIQPPASVNITSSDDVIIDKDVEMVDREEAMMRCNNVIEEILDGTYNVSIITSPAQLASQTFKQSKNGFAHPGSIAELTTQILMNLFCNDVQRPIDGTCCQKPPPITVLQFTAFIFAMICIALSIIITCVRICCHTNQQRHNDEADETMMNDDSDKMLMMKSTSYQATNDMVFDVNKQETFVKQLCNLIEMSAKLSLILIYFYICDRSDLLMKSNKHFTWMRFCIPLIYLLLIGIFGHNRSKQNGILNNEQENELKGWMVLFVLVYQMTAAYQVPWIQMQYKLCISMFLFISGFTNFHHYWNTGDFGLRRMFTEIMKWNFLAVLLCVVMNRTYQFYSFVPLFTFWFLVLYITMAIPPRAHLSIKNTTISSGGSGIVKNGGKLSWIFTSPYSIASFKFIILILLISASSHFQKEFSSIFTIWPTVRLFEQTRGSIEEWWNIVQFDRFSMLFGAIISFIYQLFKRFSWIDDLKQGCLFSTKSSLIAFCLSFFTFFGFSYWTFQCAGENCSTNYTYLCILPMTSYLLLRNIPGYFRSGFSSFFAWFGKIYIELMTSRYHIWSAADGQGVLVLMTSLPMFNLMMTSLIFVCVSHELHQITKFFIRFFVSHDSPRRLFVRIFLLFAAILLFVIVNDVTNSRSSS